MQQIVKIFPNVVFFLSSNESLSEAYGKFPLIKKNDNTAAYDMYALSKCDYVIGPPSTFSYWASFMGRNKLHHIRMKNEILTIASFMTTIRGCGK